MGRRNSLLSLALSAVVSAAGHAYAVTNFHADLTNAQEGPITPTLTNGQSRPASFGTADFVLNDAQTAMTFTATIFNVDVTGSQTADINDNLLNAHIHAGTNTTPGANGIITQGVVWGFFGSPFNDNNPNDFVMTPFATGVGGTFSGKWDNPEGNPSGQTLAAQLASLFAGRGYINFHTQQFGSGEIRGQILPEPASFSLLAFGSLGLLRRRRRA